MSSEISRPAVRRPIPEVDELSREFWEGAANGLLVIQRCTACRRFHHPPRSLCTDCGETRQTYVPVSGEARLWSWTVTHHKIVAGLIDVIPYICLTVELVEQPRLFLMSDFIGDDVPLEQFKVGCAMRVIFEPVGEGGIVLPQFRPAPVVTAS